MKTKNKKRTNEYNQKLLEIIRKNAAKSNSNIPANS